MTTLEEMSPTRHDIRYALFRMQAGTERVKPAPSGTLVAALRDHFSYALVAGGYSWEDFHGKWDVGVDDATTAALRPETWWCFGISRFKLVPRLSLYERVTPSALFLAGGYAKRGERGKIELDYGKIMEGLKTRDSWVPEITIRLGVTDATDY